MWKAFKMQEALLLQTNFSLAASNLSRPTPIISSIRTSSSRPKTCTRSPCHPSLLELQETSCTLTITSHNLWTIKVESLFQHHNKGNQLVTKDFMDSMLRMDKWWINRCIISMISIICISISKSIIIRKLRVWRWRRWRSCRVKGMSMSQLSGHLSRMVWQRWSFRSLASCLSFTRCSTPKSSN